MVRVREIIEVTASPNDAFDYVADFANSAEWDPGVESAERVGSGPIGVGSEYRLVVTFRKTRLPMTYRCTEYESPRRVVLEGEGSTIHALDEIVVEPSPSGSGSRITYTADLSMKGVLKAAEPFLRGAFDAMGERALAGMKRELDRS